MAALGGLITLDDLAHYQPKIREVLHATYTLDSHHWEILGSPPPSSGGVAVIEAMNMLQDVPLMGWDDPQSVLLVAEVMRRVFADRAAYLADPDFSNVPIAGLMPRNFLRPSTRTTPLPARMFAPGILTCAPRELARVFRRTPSLAWEKVPTPRTSRWWMPREMAWPAPPR
jgi:gamma-glutamyltranspeptidase/glutathione hydrolase